MPVDSIADFIESIHASRLLETVQLDELARHLSPRFPEPRAMAAELIRRGWLTPYQINQLFQGRGRDLLLDSYVLLERLGEGGMGQVFKARNWKLGKIVALKLIRKERLANAEAVRRFLREVRAAAQLNHPNVVHAFDSGECGDKLFFVMEYVEGVDLAKLIRVHGPLPVAQACDCVRQAAHGLQHAFERGLVHRDIKPHNLLLSRAGDGGTIVKILDMGLARLSDSSDSSEVTSAMTQEGTVLGTLDYISPEQALNAHTADTRADLYSLGCTLYFLLAGRPPFPGGTATEKLLKHQMEQPPPIEQLRPDVSPTVAAIVRKLMAKRPAERYQTPAEAAAILAAVLSGVSLADSVTPETAPAAAAVEAMADTIAGWSSIVETAPSATVRSVRRKRKAERRRSLLFSAVGVLASLALLGLLVHLLGRQDSPPPSTNPSAAEPESIKETEEEAFENWIKKVAKQTPDWQVKAVAAKLRERNHGFSGIVKPTIEKDVVVGLEFNSDHVSDISPLRALVGLKRLRCVSEKRLGTLTDLSPLKELPLQEIVCDFRMQRDGDILRSIPTLKRINRRPAAEFWKAHGKP